MDCKFCPSYKALFSNQVVILKNSKFCKLYPKDVGEANKEIINFERCKTLYTRCDYLLEQSVHDKIIKLEEILKKYQNVLQQELETQNKFINDVWLQSKRYLILTKGVLCAKSYPEVISNAAEKRALWRFHTSLRNINKSNCILAQSMENILISQYELSNECKQLDMTVESPFINGTYSLNSLCYTITLLSDLIYYFQSHLCNIKSQAQLLNLTDSLSIEEYMKLIK